MPAFALVCPPLALTLRLRRTDHAPLPLHAERASHSFGGGLEPRWIVGATARSTSELLRTLSRMAASKPTSWLSMRRDLLAHLARTLGP
jgi:hypothetical protein